MHIKSHAASLSAAPAGISNAAPMSAQTATPNGGTAESGAAITDFSNPAQLISELQRLRNKDIHQFQKVMKSIAHEIRAQAKTVGNEASSYLLKQATGYDAVAKSGDLSQLQPPPNIAKALSDGLAAYQSAGNSAMSKIDSLVNVLVNTP